MTAPAQGDQVDIHLERTAPRPVQEDVIAAYEGMIQLIPDAGNEGIESILRQIAGATDATGLDAPWNSSGLATLVGTPIRITGARKMESDFDGPLPWFLVLDCVVHATGDMKTITTGSVSVVAQVVQAYNLGTLPLDVIPRQAKRPTKDGYFPMHLEVMK